MQRRLMVCGWFDSMMSSSTKVVQVQPGESLGRCRLNISKVIALMDSDSCDIFFVTRSLLSFTLCVICIYTACSKPQRLPRGVRMLWAMGNIKTLYQQLEFFKVSGNSNNSTPEWQGSLDVGATWCHLWGLDVNMDITEGPPWFRVAIEQFKARQNKTGLTHWCISHF